jgi:hypothetical protein
MLAHRSAHVKSPQVGEAHIRGYGVPKLWLNVRSTVLISCHRQRAKDSFLLGKAADSWPTCQTPT